MLPCQRQTKSQGSQRRSHSGLRVPNITHCPDCQKPKLHHAACECGYVRPGLKLQLSRNK